MVALLIHYMAPIMFASLVVFLLLGYPVAFSLAANGLIFGLIGIELGLFHARFPAGAAGARLRRHEQRHAARDPVLHLHGTDPRTLRHGGGPARHHRAVVRHDPRRPRLCGDLRRRAAGGDHRRGRRLGHLDGADLAADHAALRLRPARRLRRDRGLRNAGADHPALAGADRDGRPARPLGRRHVRGRVSPRPHAGGPLCRLCGPGHPAVPQAAPGLPVEAIEYREDDGGRGLVSLGVLFVASSVVGGACDARLGDPRGGLRRALDVRRHRLRLLRRRGELALRPDARAPVPVAARPAGDVRDGAAAVPDLPRARHHLHRRRDPDRRRRHGRERRACPGADQAAADVGPDAPGGGDRPPSSRLSWSSS